MEIEKIADEAKNRNQDSRSTTQNYANRLDLLCSTAFKNGNTSYRLLLCRAFGTCSEYVFRALERVPAVNASTVAYTVLDVLSQIF